MQRFKLPVAVQGPGMPQWAVAQQRDSMRMDFAIRIGTAAEGTEVTGAMTVEDCLGHG